MPRDFGLTSSLPPRSLPSPIVDVVAGVSVIREEKILLGRHGANGTKARALWELAKAAKEQGLRGFCTAGGRLSTQSLMCCRIAQSLQMRFAYHCPTGEDYEIMKIIRQQGFDIHQHSPGYASVCNARAKEQAKKDGWLYIPTGVEGQAMVDIVASVACRVPWEECQKLVVPVGSGMTLSGILHGLLQFCGNASSPPPVLGIQIGGNPLRRLKKWAPAGWDQWCTIINAKEGWKKQAASRFGDIPCDPVYSGKCIPFLEGEGVFWWNSGTREIAL